MQYLQLTPSGKLPDISGLRPYKAVIIIEAIATPTQQAHISQWLVESGCLYMMAWGDNCASWDKSVQLANREAFVTPEIPDTALVITTWHEDELLKDVFWFAKYTATHPCCKLDNALLLHLAATENEQKIGAQYADI
jgi:hypothetical protein